MAALAVTTIVAAPFGSDHLGIFGPADTDIPDWALEQMDAHCFVDGKKPASGKPKSADKESAQSAASVTDEAAQQAAALQAAGETPTVEAAPEDFESMTKDQLVEICKARGVKSDGNKPDLIARLTAE